MDLMTKLKEVCRPSHYHVRASSYANKIMQKELSLHEYACLLLANYWFHQYIEQQVNTYFNASWKAMILWEERIKSIHAQHDLATLGVDTKTLKPLYIHGANSALTALGSLYVAEGTAIGGAIIKKKLIVTPELAQSKALSFYGCYGKKLSSLWKLFEEFVRNFPNYNHQVVTESALHTFNIYEALLDIASKRLSEEALNHLVATSNTH